MGVSKSRKVVRPRLKTELSSRQFRIVKSGSDLVRAGGVVGGGAADSTTESDEPGKFCKSFSAIKIEISIF